MGGGASDGYVGGLGECIWVFWMGLGECIWVF